MALEELKTEIEHDAKIEAARIEKESESECERITSDAMKMADNIRKTADERLGAKIGQRRLDYASSLEDERSSMIADAAKEAVDSSMDEFLQLVRKKLESAEQEIIKSALERFSNVVPLKQAVARIDRRNEKMVEGIGRIEEAKIKGIILSSKDGSISADATIDSLLESNAEIARRSLYKGLVG